jgi:PAS domain S-box-containing protein
MNGNLAKLARLNLVLLTIRNIHQILFKEKDRQQLLQKICDKLVEMRGYHNAWIALWDHNRRIIGVAEAGLGQDLDPVLARFEAGGSITCVRRIMKQSHLELITDPGSICTDCSLATSYADRAAISVKLEYNGQVYGFLVLSTPIEIGFDSDEQDLVRGVADDIAFGLHKIRVETELAQTKSELELTRFSIDHAMDMLYWMDQTGNIVDVNDATCKRLGYTRSELTALNVVDVDQGITRTDYPRLWRDLKSEGTAKVISMHRRKHGGVIPVEVTHNYIRFENRQYDCAFARDITDRLENEKIINDNMRDLRKRIKELNCLFRLSSLVEQRSLTVKELLQGTVDLIPSAMKYPDSACARIELLENQATTRAYKETPWLLKSEIRVHGVKQGLIKVFYTQERPLSDQGPFLKEEQNLLRVISGRLGRILERRQAEADLQASEKRFRDLVEYSLIGILIVRDGDIVYANPEHVRLFGQALNPFGPDFAPHIHPDDRQKAAKLFDSIVSGTKQMLELDFRFSTKTTASGSHGTNSDPNKWVQCRASQIEVRGRRAICFNTMDLTQAKKLEHMIKVQDKMASLGRVTAGIAHEIRNPLSGINIYINTLEKLFPDLEQHGRVEEIFNQLQSASGKIETVIRRVIDFAKPGAPNFVLTDINAPINDALQLMAVTLRKSGSTIVTDLDRDMPAVRIDPHLIEELFINLLTNATDAMKKKVGKKKIGVRSYIRGDFLILEVIDSGVGVPVESREVIFDPFHTTKSDSTGIGLSLCRRIVTDHGGTIAVGTSAWGGGKFTVEIPL